MTRLEKQYENAEGKTIEAAVLKAANAVLQEL